jgi:CubicO group peptidase (beta-lactamase class C family)
MSYAPERSTYVGTQRRHLSYLLALAMLCGCGGDDSPALDAAHVDGAGAVDASADASTCDQAAATAALIAALDAVETDVDFTLLLRDSAGRDFSHSIGASTAQTLYESASTSKWVAAAAILELVDQGVLAIDDNPQDYIPTWTTESANPLSSITLAQLLSFTSGLENAPLCINLPGADFANCVDTVHDNNYASPVEPGTGFYYASTHLQVAGLMAINAADKTSWTEVFADFKTSTGLFPNGAFDLPSAANPRLAGGMHWRADEYLDFLDACYHDQILSAALKAQVLADHIAGVTIVESPADAIGQEWHYGWGFWLECASATYDCTGITRISSPGAYGAYPFIDYEHAYFGILARQGGLATFPDGLAIFAEVRAEVEAWAGCR